MTQFSSPLFFERYELKYHIPIDKVDEISSFVECYCELDPYSEREPDKFYKVNNIYLDTPQNLFLARRVSGMDHRFNLRIRAYGEDVLFPYFFEIKYKTHGIVKKKRSKISEEDWQYFIENGMFPENNEPISKINNYKEQFLRLIYSYNAGPKVFSQYRRKAYASVVDEYARVTFDRDLRYEPRENYDLTPREENLIHYDHQNYFEPDANVILELKCTTQVPLWFVDLIRTFELKRASFSKYVSSMTEFIPTEDSISWDRDTALNF